MEVKGHFVAMFVKTSTQQRVSVGWKRGNNLPCQEAQRHTYWNIGHRRAFWMMTQEFFLTKEVEKVSFLIFMDTKHHVHNLVVVQLTIYNIVSLHEIGY